MKKLGCFCNICGCDVEECAGWGLKPSKNPCRFTFHLPAEASIHVCEDCILALAKAAETLTRGISPVHPPPQEDKDEGRFYGLGKIK